MLFSFLIVFLTVYGGLHYYIFKKLSYILPDSLKVIAVVLLLLMFTPVITEILAHSGLGSGIRPLAWTGYYWMGLAFLMASGFLFVDILQVVYFIMSKLTGVKYDSQWFVAQKVIYTVSIFAVLISIYGIQRASSLSIEDIHIDSRLFTFHDRPFRVAQISDVHFGLLSDKKRAQKVVELLRQINPDLIVSTGDLIDMQVDHISELADIVSQLSPPYGKYAVMGNHEAYAGAEQSQAFFQRAGFILLSNTGVSITDKISLIGVDDPAIAMQTKTDRVDEAELLTKLKSDRFTILLKHQPVVNDASVGQFDLQLSGHTHGGQVFPFSILTRIAYKMAPGLTQITNDSWIYVSRGTGTWGPPMRVGADPEITVFEIK